MPIALFILGLTIFGLGTTEFMIAGLLPELADSFDVTVPQAGHLISLFAIGVTVGAPLITMLASRVPRKATLVTLLAVFLVGELVAATSQSYGVLMAARLITAVAHGAFFGIGAVVAAGLVEPAKRARAISIMFGGLTVATIAGAPLGAFLGQHFGWRAPFWAVFAIGAVGLLGVILLVPHQPREQGANLRGELAAFRRLNVWLALATTLLSQAALFAAYTYVTPLLTDITGFGEGAVPVLLTLFGIGTFCGSWIGGKFADRNLMRTLWIGMILLGGMLLLFQVSAHNKVAMVITLAAFGVASFLINPGLQTRVMNEAGEAPSLASAGNISAFNIGNAVGPWTAGLAIAGGHGYLSPAWVGVAFAAAALVTALASTARDASARRTAGASAPAGAPAQAEPAVAAPASHS
ncbi:Cmx/CmrA family chloramphenicol efflux MFS transporter [Kitasatospora brasiliensis]|uniref:Cmx/CmrA family chloramphenicol efflux MFS transporter n=1 Tax=Kitasatospora brasiliensis TaxID=3058040 RepID=UPI0029314B4B|nr:Cmx/CmrA family chloramphenicol efflux MFS transporter [Kitasatospora sp. K002]